jgi:ribosomal protein S18 acetylase RimI-like enzyme
MIDEIDFKIRTALLTDRSRLANLIHFGTYTHQHLDWKPPLDWIGSKPYLVLEQGGEAAAILACPPELPEIAWIRLFATSSLIDVRKAWNSLWAAAAKELSQLGNICIAAISLQSWFNDLLEASKFEYTDNVIVLLWEGSMLLPQPSATNISIRPMLSEDLDLITEIDHDAFETVWKNSTESLALAFEQSSQASVAELGNEIVGYQYSTASMMGGHLARLAVKKKMQGKGIGYLLVHQLLSQFGRQGVRHVTVNTQKNNGASLAVYARAGFKVTGESYRVYQQIIDG